MQCEAWLTPTMKEIWPVCAASGRVTVHSVFDSVANLAFCLPDIGEKRLFTLACTSIPRLPDSARVSRTAIHMLEAGMQAEAQQSDTGYLLALNGETYVLEIQPDWDGRFTKRLALCLDCVRETAQLLDAVKTGFSMLPVNIRTRAEAALLTKNAPDFLGLGSGLTPSYDDACIGVMACCAAFQYPAPFQLNRLQRTTDISARYLRLAREGHFGEPLWQLMHAWGTDGDTRQAADTLLQVGATSGADMLYGAVAIARSILKGKAR